MFQKILSSDIETELNTFIKYHIFQYLYKVKKNMKKKAARKKQAALLILSLKVQIIFSSLLSLFLS